MYLEHYGIERPPFKITPDTSLFYEGNKRGAALDALEYAILSGEGIIKVVGEVGSGKTMLCRMLELRLDGKVDVVYIANPSLSPDNILPVIAHELGLELAHGADKLEVMQSLQKYLIEKHAANTQVVVFVEEAQSMPIETLEEIRLLSNLETDQSKLLQMVLFGQPELDENLSQPHIRQLKERITHSFYLDPFPPEDTLEYLNFRMRSVGYRGPDIFNSKTANHIKKISGGLTRRINIVADKALMSAFSEGKHQVSKQHIRTAALDSDFIKPLNWKPYAFGAAMAASLCVAVWTGMQLSSTPLQSVPVASEQLPDTAAVAEEAVTVNASVLALGQVDDLLETRLGDTCDWLLSVPDNHYSIQLFMARTVDADAVEQFLREAPDMLDFEKIYIYETQINGRPMYSVLYDEYSDRTVARSKLNDLPDALQASKPYLRRVSALRKDLLAQHQREDTSRG